MCTAYLLLREGWCSVNLLLCFCTQIFRGFRIQTRVVFRHATYAGLYYPHLRRCTPVWRVLATQPHGAAYVHVYVFCENTWRVVSYRSQCRSSTSLNVHESAYPVQFGGESAAERRSLMAALLLPALSSLLFALGCCGYWTRKKKKSGENICTATDGTTNRQFAQYGSEVWRE